MKNITTIIRKEFKCLAGSGASTFLIYALLSVIWSVALSSLGGDDLGSSGSLWFVFFSVIISANFSSTVFISERVNGTLEVLITSGLSRSAVLFGKMLFVIIMTAGIGAACVAMSFVWGAALSDMFAAGGTDGVSHATGWVARTGGIQSSGDIVTHTTGGRGRPPLHAYDGLLYLCATCLNAAASAYFSVRMSNPRFLHFINLLMIAVLVSVYSVLSSVMEIHSAILSIGILLIAGIFTILAKREFNGERIIRPVIF